MRCKACNNELKNPRSRFIAEAGITVVEDLCPKCLEAAMEAVYRKDLTDEQFIDLLGIELYVETYPDS